MTWFSQSWLTKRGVPRRDREWLENRPVIFLALRPRSRAGGRGGSAKTSPKVIGSRRSALRRVDSAADSHAEFSELSADHPESRSFLREISTDFLLNHFAQK